jgi:hypothetical protein
MGQYKFWSQEEIRFLEENYPDRGVKYCAEKLKRSSNSVRSRAIDLKIRNKTKESLVGQTFGRLLVLEQNGINRFEKRLWKCLCLNDGNIVEVITSYLRNGSTKSCGCFKKEMLEHRIGQNHPNFGKKWPAEQMERMSGKKAHMYGRKKEEHPAWNNNLSMKDRELSKVRNHLPQTYQWRKMVYERDNHTCQLSGQKGGKLCAHHIRSWHSYEELRFELANGITLSQKIHRLFHNLYGNRNNTSQQFEEFKQRYNDGEFSLILK